MRGQSSVLFLDHCLGLDFLPHTIHTMIFMQPVPLDTSTSCLMPFIVFLPVPLFPSSKVQCPFLFVHVSVLSITVSRTYYTACSLPLSVFPILRSTCNRFVLEIATFRVSMSVVSWSNALMFVCFFSFHDAPVSAWFKGCAEPGAWPSLHLDVRSMENKLLLVLTTGVHDTLTTYRPS